MSLRFTIWLCAIIVGASNLTACQPPTPRILKAEVPGETDVISVGIAAQGSRDSFNLVERIVQVPDAVASVRIM